MDLMKRWRGGGRLGEAAPGDGAPPEDTRKVRRYYLFRGRVQGVGFRYEAFLLAERLRLVGWIRNRPEGDVEAELEGTPEGLEEFLRAMRAIRRIHITGVLTRDLPVQGSETELRVIY